jgi:hypothetical protein
MSRRWNQFVVERNRYAATSHRRLAETWVFPTQAAINLSAFRRDVRPIWPQLRAMNAAMKTVFVIFVLALLTIAGEIYSDAVMTSGQVANVAVPDPVTIAVAHGTPHGKLSHNGV